MFSTCSPHFCLKIATALDFLNIIFLCHSVGRDCALLLFALLTLIIFMAMTYEALLERN